MPDNIKDGIPGVSILINGTSMDPAIQLISVDVKRAISSIGHAELVLALSLDMDTQDEKIFPLFNPGNRLEIQAGYDAKLDSIFKGMILQQGLRTGLEGMPEMVVQCSEEAIRMTLGHKNAFFRQKTDAEIMRELIAQNGLNSEVDSTDFNHPQLIQFQSTDWDFILSRAAANGLVVYTEDDKVYVKAIQDSQAPALKASYYDGEIMHVDLAHDVSANLAGVGNKVWDKGLRNTSVQTLKGTLTMSGDARPRINFPIELKGFGARYNGNALVSGIHHKFYSGVWSTTLGFGRPMAKETIEIPSKGPSKEGILPSVYGLQNGIVKQMDQDPEGAYRILVDVPVFDPTGAGLWARFAQEYAGAGAGSFFYPEIGDEVILGFLNEDPRYPVILGMTYSIQNHPPFMPEAQNHMKGFVTRSGLQLSFDDENKMVAIKTPAGNECILSETDQSILLKNQTGHSVLLDNQGIVLDSKNDLVIKANGKIIMQATGDLQLEGMNVNASAQIALKATGTASAELSASGQTIIEGAMVKIN